MLRLRQQERVLHGLEMLVNAGLPLPEGLKRVATLDLSAPYAKAVRKAAERIESGTSLADAWKGFGGLFTKQFTAMIALGEEAGELAETCRHLKESSRREARKRYRILTDAVVPLYVVFAGAINLAILVSAHVLINGMANNLFL